MPQWEAGPMADLRVNYSAPRFGLAQAAVSPLALFSQWYQHAVKSAVAEPNAVSLATAGDGGPSVRNVLAKSVTPAGLVFFTNLESTKAEDIRSDDRVGTCFNWYSIHRQVRMDGRASLLPREEVDAYFASRPRGAQISAWASPQSRPLPDRRTLDRTVTRAQRRFSDIEHVPTPPHWGGYLVRPRAIEFWMGQQSRCHDRILFTAEQETPPSLDSESGWDRTRLAP